MIDARELRIGNWVEAVTPMGNYYMKMTEHNFENVVKNPYCALPIDLTSGMLEQCGFKFITDWSNPKDDGFCWLMDLKSLRLGTGMMGYAVTLFDKESISTGISVNYLHQLQNLFFALTNTELNIQKL